MLKKVGQFPEKWKNPVYPEPCFLWLYEAFNDLDSTRINGMSTGRISVNEIFDYCFNLGYNQEETDFLKMVIMKLDIKYLELSKEIEKEDDKKKAKANEKRRKFGNRSPQNKKRNR